MVLDSRLQERGWLKLRLESSGETPLREKSAWLLRLEDTEAVDPIRMVPHEKQRQR